MVFLFLLVSLLLPFLMLLGRLSWSHLRCSHASTGSRRTLVPRLLKPRSPDDCPACCLASPPSSAVVPVHPWREGKSRRGAPKRINTEGFACPNPQCAYFGITEAHIHVLVGDGKHGRAERIQTFRCQACHTTFSARRDTPLYRLKPPSSSVAKVLSVLAEGLDPSAAERVNLTIRHGIAALARRTWATAQQSPHLLAHLEWWRAYYHFVRPHAALRVALVQPHERGGNRLAQRYRQRTPAMAADRTTRRWTAREVLCHPLSPVLCVRMGA